MNRSVAAAASRPSLLSFAAGLSPLSQLGAVLVGTGLLTASSWIQVPMVPVPITMQTLAVTMIGAFYGPRLAGLTVLAWLVEAACGLPVLAGGHAGLAYMAGPTGGYLVAFAIAAALVGWSAERGWLGRSLGAAAAVMLAANLFMILFGAAWLAVFSGPSAAIALGVTPFLVGGAVKAALGAGLVEASGRFRLRNGR